MAVRIVTDSTCDLPQETIDRLGITVVPLTVYFGDEAFLDKVEIDAAAFMARLSSGGALPKTSQPSVEQFRAAFEKVTADGSDVVTVVVSAKLSGTLNSATLATREVSGGERIALVDSELTSLALGLVVIEAAEAAAAGKTKDEVVEVAKRAAERTKVYLMVDTLEFLQRGGRIGRAGSLLGSILSIKPLLWLKDGAVEPLERIRTRGKAVERLFEIATEKPNAKAVFVGSAGDLESARALADRISAALPNASMMVGDLGPVVSVHTGPRALGLAVLDGE